MLYVSFAWLGPFRKSIKILKISKETQDLLKIKIKVLRKHFLLVKVHSQAILRFKYIIFNVCVFKGEMSTLHVAKLEESGVQFLSLFYDTRPIFLICPKYTYWNI